jgi:hypothetical protein
MFHQKTVDCPKEKKKRIHLIDQSREVQSLTFRAEKKHQSSQSRQGQAAISQVGRQNPNHFSSTSLRHSNSKHTGWHI